MAETTPEELAMLAPFIAGASPDSRGETNIFCPVHADAKRSASLNAKKGVWFCHAGCGGGSVRHLVESMAGWIPMAGREGIADASGPATLEAPPTNGKKPTIDVVRRWNARLLRDRRKVDELYERRGIETHTAGRALLGYNGTHFKIPVFSPGRELWNVRTYDPDPQDGRRKIWSVRGMGQARLYPVGFLTERSRPGDAVLLCEGEWDALLAIQSGYNAVTRTDGAGKPWHDEWTDLFAGLRVFICQDRDHTGVKAEMIHAQALVEVAEEVRICRLPFELAPKDGADLSDFILDNDEPGIAVGELMAEAEQVI